MVPESGVFHLLRLAVEEHHAPIALPARLFVGFLSLMSACFSSPAYAAHWAITYSYTGTTTVTASPVTLNLAGPVRAAIVTAIRQAVSQSGIRPEVANAGQLIGVVIGVGLAILIAFYLGFDAVGGVIHSAIELP